MRPLLKTQLALLLSTLLSLLFARIHAEPDTWKQKGSFTSQPETIATIDNQEEPNYIFNKTLSELTERTGPEVIVFPGASNFDPSGISGLIAWYASKDAYSDTGSTIPANHYESVLRWKDQSPNNVSLSPGTAGNNPLIWKKGKKCLQFFNPNYMTRSWGLLQSSSARTIVVHFNTRSTANGAIVSWGEAFAGGVCQAAIFSGGIGFAGYGIELTTPITTSNYADGNWHTMVIRYDGMQMTLHLDGVQKAQSNLTLATGNSDLLIGKSISGADYYVGKLGHVVLYNRKIADAEMVDLFAYLVADMETFTDGTAGAAPNHASQPVQLIMDLDMAVDVDDAAALGIAWRLNNLGECNVLATIANSANDKSASTIKAINNFYGKTTCPVGAYKGIVPDNYHSVSAYTSVIASEFAVNLSRNTYTDALVTYRTALSAAADNSVVICQVGFFTNLMDLLQSPADGISPLTGMQLVTQKVKRLVAMGGKHVMNDNASEFNYDGHPAATMYVYSKWPTDIVNADYYIGVSVYIKPDDFRSGATDPIKRIWDIVQMNSTRSSWDELAVLYAVRGLQHKGETYFNFATTPGKDLVNANGFNRWANEPGNMQYLVKVAADTTFGRILTTLLGLNRPPIANGFVMMYYYPDAHLLNAWGSYDAEGEQVKFRWTKIAGPSQYHMLYPEASTPVISELVEGTYSFQLRVTDNEGATSYDTVQIIQTTPLSQTNNNRRSLTEFEQRSLINNKLIISPNPVLYQLNLKWNSDYLGDAKLTVMDMSGRRVIHLDLNKAGTVYSSILPVNSLKPGSYYLFVRMNNGRSVSSIFIRR